MRFGSIINEDDQQNHKDDEQQGAPWTKEQEDLLINLFAKKVPIADIASTLQRTKGAVRSRLKKLGFSD